MQRRLTRELVGLAVLLLGSPVQADVLFSQPVLNGGVALASDLARLQQEADRFVLPQGALAQSVHWWGAYANNDLRTDTFTLRFFNDGAGNPAAVPFADVSLPNVTRTATNLLDNLGDPIYEYQATLARPIALDGATAYYLSVVNNTPPGGVWDWVGSGPGTHWARQDDASTWTVSSTTTNFAFELTGTPVPEPPTVLLLGIGTLAVVGWVWLERDVPARKSEPRSPADGSDAPLRSIEVGGKRCLTRVALICVVPDRAPEPDRTSRSAA